MESKHIYQRDPRLGIGLNTDSRTAEEGQIYTTEGFAFSPKEDKTTVYLCQHWLFGRHSRRNRFDPRQGVLRLGGDGRSAHYRKVYFHAPTVANMHGTPGPLSPAAANPSLFTHGWLPAGVTAKDRSYRLQARWLQRPTRLRCTGSS